MKKIILTAVLICTMLCHNVYAACPFAPVQTFVNVQAQCNVDTGIITLNGSVSSGSGKRVVVRIYDNNNSMIYINQQLTDSEGDFEFKCQLPITAQSGNYKYSVTQKFISQPEEGNFNVDLSQSRPTVSNLSISGESIVGNTVTAQYTYICMSGIVESGSVIKWQASDSINGVFSTVQESTEKNLVIPDDCSYKYIKYSVIPKNINGVSGEEIAVDTPVICKFLPTVDNVRINGVFCPGNIVRVEYDFEHRMNFAEAQSKISWFVDGTEVGTGTSYSIKDTDIDKSIYVTVTPHTDNYVSCYGIPKSSASHTITSLSNNTTQTRPSGGGGGGSSIGSVTVSVPVQNYNAPENIENIDFSKKFSDIDNCWAKEDIIHLASIGIINGTSEDKFEPDRNVTRAEFAQMVYRLLKPETQKYNSSFNDVSSESWYSFAVCTLCDLNIFVGSDLNFYPDNYITKQEAAVVIYRIMAYKSMANEITGEFKDFLDLDSIDSWAFEYMLYAVNNGFINGSDDNCLYPRGQLTRQQTAAIIERIYKSIN